MGGNRVELYVHLVWGTTGRRSLITASIRADLFGLIAAKTTELRCVPGRRGQRSLLAFANHRLGLKGSFEWQSGFGAFTIATDDVPAVSNWVNAQQKHHAMHALEPRFELGEEI